MSRVNMWPFPSGKSRHGNARVNYVGYCQNCDVEIGISFPSGPFPSGKSRHRNADSQGY